MNVPVLRSMYEATWLWLPLLLLYLIVGLRCHPNVKLVLHRIAKYYIICVIGLQLLIPNAHQEVRFLLFDLATRAFLFIYAAELLWFSWNEPSALAAGGNARALKQRYDEEEGSHGKLVPGRRVTAHQVALVGYGCVALVYLGWMVLGVLFSFSLTPGM